MPTGDARTRRRGAGRQEVWRDPHSRPGRRPRGRRCESALARCRPSRPPPPRSASTSRRVYRRAGSSRRTRPCPAGCHGRPRSARGRSSCGCRQSPAHHTETALDEMGKVVYIRAGQRSHHRPTCGSGAKERNVNEVSHDLPVGGGVGVLGEAGMGSAGRMRIASPPIPIPVTRVAVPVAHGAGAPRHRHFEPGPIGAGVTGGVPDGIVVADK